MRLKTINVRSALCLSAVFCFASMRARAQEPVCTPGVFNYNGYGVSGKPGTAYTIKIKSTLEQRLPDGNYIRGYIHTIQARDSKGKALSQFPQGCYLDKDGKPTPQMNVSVSDPESKTSESWMIGDRFGNDKTAHIHHMLPPKPPKKLSPEELAAQRKLIQERQPPRSEFKTEELGTRTIAGITATGTRTTRTIPAGEEGNELPLVVVNENWFSKDLGMGVMFVNDDPRRGRTTWEIEEISRTEPDAALFNSPADYKIVEDTPPAETLAKQ